MITVLVSDTQYRAIKDEYNSRGNTSISLDDYIMLKLWPEIMVVAEGRSYLVRLSDKNNTLTSVKVLRLLSKTVLLQLTDYIEAWYPISDLQFIEEINK